MSDLQHLVCRILDSLAKTAAEEIIQIFETRFEMFSVELSERQKEIDTLRQKLEFVENERAGQNNTRGEVCFCRRCEEGCENSGLSECLYMGNHTEESSLNIIKYEDCTVLKSGDLGGDQDIFEGRTFEFASEEELFTYREDLDCPYCRDLVTASKDHLLKRHLRFAVRYVEGKTVKFSIPCFCGDGGRGRSHWHCPKCKKILQRSHDFKVHMKNHGVVLAGKPSDQKPDLSTGQTEKLLKDIESTGKKRKAVLTNPWNLRRQDRGQGEKENQLARCVDAKNGIYVTPKDAYGPRLPVHVVKSSVTGRMFCELDECKDSMDSAAVNGSSGKECRHLERAGQSKVCVPPPPLRSDSLQEMVNRGLISSLQQEQCQELYTKARSAGIDCVFPIFWGENGFSEKCAYFSVYTGRNERWCQTGRTRVTFDSESGQWHCQCQDTKTRQICTHKYASLWWMFQERPEYVQNRLTSSLEGKEDLEKKFMETDIAKS